MRYVSCMRLRMKKIILIIDEWDAMFRECKGQDKILDTYILLLRSLFKSSLTDQLFAGVYMTGILPIRSMDMNLRSAIFMNIQWWIRTHYRNISALQRKK